MMKIRCYRFFNFFYIYGLYILFFVWTIGLSDYSYGPNNTRWYSGKKTTHKTIPGCIVGDKTIPGCIVGKRP